MSRRPEIINRCKLHDQLVDAFILYQWRLENPFPQISESKEIMAAKYRSDPIFHAKVKSMACGVMEIVDACSSSANQIQGAAQ